MMRSLLLASATLAAGTVLGAGAASSQDLCRSTFDDYGDPLGQVTCTCQASAPNGVVYGTGIYTSDSDLCTAARHAGAVGGDGAVVAQGAPGCESYAGSTQNGVTSNAWAAWDRSVFFPGQGDGTCVSGAADTQMEQQAGDALAVLLAMLQAAPPETITYEDAKSLGPRSFEMTGIVIKPEGPESAIPVAKLTVDDIDMASLMQGQAPGTLKMRVEGIAFDESNLDLGPELWEMLETDTLLANIALDFVTDQATRGATLNDLTIELPGFARLAFELDMLGIDTSSMMTSPEMAMFSAALRSASVTFEDETILGRSLSAAVKETGLGEQQLLDEALQEIANALAEIGAQPGDRVYAVGEVLGGLLTDARSPKGPVVFALAPETPVNFGQISATPGPNEAAELLNLQVSYAGSRATLPEPQPEAYSYDEEGGAFTFTDQDLYKVGDTVVVYWSGLPGNPQDLITVAAKGSPSDQRGEWWIFSDGQTDGLAEVPGLEAGDYEVRIYYDWPNGTEVQAVYEFTVGQ